MKAHYYIFFIISLLYSCATPIPPSGGDKDIEAPEVLLAMPASGSANYQGDVIEILFDEYFTLASSEQNILITPSMGEKPNFLIKGKKLIIKLPEGLNPDLTYSISFLDAIKDFNEGNVLKTFKYVFSRGEAIDSASVSGKVVDAAFGEGQADVFVGLYMLGDTAILSKSIPIYITRTDPQGTFSIDYVKSGQYIAAAIKDKNFNYIFDQVSEDISLPSLPFVVEGKVSLTEDIVLFKNEVKSSVDGHKVLNNNKLYVYFTQEVEEFSLDVLPFNKSNLFYVNTLRDTLFYHWTEQGVKSLELFLTLDGGPVDTVTVPINKMEMDSRFNVAASLNKGERILLKAPKPVIDVRMDRIMVQDSSENRLAFTLTYEKEIMIFEVTALNSSQLIVQIDSGAVNYYDNTWNEGRIMKSISVEGEVVKSKLILNFINTAPVNTYLDLLNKDKKKLKSFDISNSSSLSIPSIQPGRYFVRIYEDRNQNGKWTTGNFELKRAPEKIYLISPSIEIKPNWDKDLNLDF